MRKHTPRQRMQLVERHDPSLPCVPAPGPNRPRPEPMTETEFAEMADAAAIESIHLRKSAALIAASVLAGAGLLWGGRLFSPGPLNAEEGGADVGGVRSHAETGGRCSACQTPLPGRFSHEPFHRA